MNNGEDQKKISEILKSLDSGSLDCSVFSDVELDIKLTLPRSDISKIGFSAPKSDDSKEIPRDFLQKLMSWSLVARDTETYLELGPGHSYDTSKILMYCSNMGINASFTPPNDGCSDEVFEQFVSDNCKALLFILTNNKPFVAMPASSYLDYIVLEIINGPNEIVPTCPYVKTVFYDAMPKDMVDKFKIRLKKYILEIFGGEEELSKATRSVLFSLVGVATDGFNFGD